MIYIKLVSTNVAGKYDIYDLMERQNGSFTLWYSYTNTHFDIKHIIHPLKKIMHGNLIRILKERHIF